MADEDTKKASRSATGVLRRNLTSILGGKGEKPKSRGTKRGTGNAFRNPDDPTQVEVLANESRIKSLLPEELHRQFETMLDDMNLDAGKKAPLLMFDDRQKREMLTMHYKDKAQSRNNKFDTPNDFREYLSQADPMSEKVFRCLESLKVCLTSNTVSWILDFGKDGVDVILMIMRTAIDADTSNRWAQKIHFECLRCLKAFMNNKHGMKIVLQKTEAFVLLAKSVMKAVTTEYQNNVLEAVRILAPPCLFPEGHKQVLLGFTKASEESNHGRFDGLIRGICVDNNLALRINCIQLMNSIINFSGETLFKIHLRNEFMRAGLSENLLESFEEEENEDMKIQMKAFRDHQENDKDDLGTQYDNMRLNFEDIDECFEAVKISLADSPCDPLFLSILQHLMFITDAADTRVAYYRLIEECVSQIVLTKNGVDPDFHRTTLAIDVEPLVGQITERVQSEKFNQTTEMAKKLEEAVTAKQEAEARITQLERQLQEGGLLSGVSVSSGASNTGAPGAPPPPPPPPFAPGSLPPGAGGPPPPPPPVRDSMGPPPPPIPPGPPKPPCAPPPPVVPLQLPFGMAAKKAYQVPVPLRKMNWNQIKPVRLNEKSFWVKVNEDRWASEDLVKSLANAFGTKNTKPDESSDVDRDSIYGTINRKKHTKELRFLEAKAAQNLSIGIGSAKMSNSEIRKAILQCDCNRLPDAVMQQMLKYLPSDSQLSQLQELSTAEKTELADAEKLALEVFGGIKDVKARLEAMSFKLRFPEFVQDIKPDIVATTAACEETIKSKKFAKVLEIILLLGNIMNTGSANAKSLGFEISYLAKLSSTKTVDNKRTLTHVLADLLEEKHSDTLSFYEELLHVEKAARVSKENVGKILNSTDSTLKKLESQLASSGKPLDKNPDDRFQEVMGSFAKSAREQIELLQTMHNKMENGCKEKFISDFRKAYDDNLKVREAEEKARLTQIAHERALKERQSNQQRRFHAELSGDDDQEGLMDTLLEALKSGNAFSNDRAVKKVRTNRGNRQAQLGRSRTRVNVVPATLLASADSPDPVSGHLNPTRPARRKQSREGQLEFENESYHTPVQRNGQIPSSKENATASYPRMNGQLTPSVSVEDDESILSIRDQWRQKRLLETPHAHSAQR